MPAKIYNCHSEVALLIKTKQIEVIATHAERTSLNGYFLYSFPINSEPNIIVTVIIVFV